MMVIPKETPYKVLGLLNRIFLEKSVKQNYLEDQLVIHFINRGYITNVNSQLHSSQKFDQIYLNDVQPFYLELQRFLDAYQLHKLQHHYTVGDVQCLMVIAIEKDKILASDLSFQQILSMYFNSSKYTSLNSNLANAIRSILNISNFHEDEKEQQYISILYPSEVSRLIILCENKNRLKMPRHRYVEYWYVGGRNVTQLAYTPKPSLPIFYLCDWDHHGINILIEIRRQYFSTIQAFVPTEFRSLYVDQKKVKHHRSIWQDDDKSMLPSLTDRERVIVNELIDSRQIIEEQRIPLSEDDLNQNLLYVAK